MKPNNCALLVKTTQKQLDEASQYKIGETTLWRDKKWSDRTHQLQICEVVGVHDDYIHEIQIGDYAIVHQQVTEESKMRKNDFQIVLEEGYEQIRYVLPNQYFGRYNGFEIFPTERKIFCDYVELKTTEEKTKSGIILLNKFTEESKKDILIETIVRYIHPSMSEMSGLKAGDKIVAKEGACYDIKIDNKQFYMVDAIGVVCRIKGEKLSLETIDLIPAIEVNHAEHY